MSKIKTVIVVLLLALAAGGSAFYGLTSFYQTEVLPSAENGINGSEKLLLDTIRTHVFEQIQSLSSHSRDSDLVDLLTQLPATSGQTIDSLKSTIEPTAKKLEPVLEKIRTGAGAEKLSLVNSEGTEIYNAPGGLSIKNIAGLPIVKDCLNGTMRDGMYEQNGKLSQLAAVPVLNSSGKPIGCLMSSQLMSKAYLQRLSKNSGFGLALILGKKIQATTLDKADSDALIASSPKEGKSKFGTPHGSLPLLVNLKNKAYAASVVKLPGGADPILLAVVVDLAKRLAPLQKAQMMVLYATGALFVFGLLIGLFLSGGGTNKEFERLRDSVKFMADGNGNIIDPDNYSGTYRELARDLKRLAEAARPVTHPGGMSSPESISQVLGKPKGEELDSQESADSGSLDFESLLGDNAGSSQPPIPNTGFSAQPETSPMDSFDSLAPSNPPPAQAAGTAAQKGPKVDMPGDLASFFDEGVQNEMDQEVTRDATSGVPAMAAPPPPAPAPMTQPPAPSASASTFPPDLDDGVEDNIDQEDEDYRPDATVIAQVPDALLKAAATATSADDDRPASASSVPPPPTSLPKPPVAAPLSLSPEESHFRKVFEDFIKTKKQCGEHIGGLTVEKFVDKLTKNSNDLKARYNCKSVTFQVYVKNGKAALKATPIK